MISIKRNYLKSTKAILKFMNEKFYSFDKVYIITECDNTFTLKLNDINKTEFRVLNQKVLIQLINALTDIKSIEFKLSDYLLKLVL